MHRDDQRPWAERDKAIPRGGLECTLHITPLFPQPPQSVASRGGPLSSFMSDRVSCLGRCMTPTAMGRWTWKSSVRSPQPIQTQAACRSQSHSYRPQTQVACRSYSQSAEGERLRAGVFYQVLDKRSESAKAGGVSGFAFEVEQVSANPKPPLAARPLLLAAAPSWDSGEGRRD